MSDNKRSPHEIMTLRALVRTYRILTPTRNLRAAVCSGCNAALPTDHGHEISESGFYVGRLRQRFLCTSCLTPVRQAHELFPPPDWDEWPPEWWGELGRAPRTTEERRQLPRPGPREIDALIAEREGKPDAK